MPLVFGISQSPPLSAQRPANQAQRRPRLRTEHVVKRPIGRSTTRTPDVTKVATASLQLFLTDTLADGETPNGTWSPGSPNVSMPPPIAHPGTSTSNWLRASLPHSTVTPCVPVCDMSAYLLLKTPSCPWDETTGGRPRMTPTLTNGRRTLSLTLRWRAPKPCVDDDGPSLVTGLGPSRPALPLLFFLLVHRFASFFPAGSCRASFPFRGCLFLPRVVSWLVLLSCRCLARGPCLRLRRTHVLVVVLV